jgi:hypothetical protein
MHSLYFLIFDKEKIKDSRQAKAKALQILEEERFCDCETFFQSGKADWFVFGGRWTGILDNFSDLDQEQKKIKPSNFWGAENDAKILDENLFNELKKKFPDVEIFDANIRDEFLLKNLEKEQAIGRWLVVIDYHY